MTTHGLKTIEPYFSDIWLGKKTFDVRFNDRNYKVGDILYLKRYNTLPKKSITCQVIYILDDPTYIKEGYIIMGIKIIAKHK